MIEIKGSIRLDDFSKQAMSESLVQLIEALLKANHLEASDVQEVLFCSTDDMPVPPAEEIAALAGFSSAGLFTLQQFRFQDDMDGCVQVILYTEAAVEQPVHKLYGCESWAVDPA